MALPSALQEAILLIKLVKQIRKQNIVKLLKLSKVYCKCFEGNSGTLELSQTPKLCPRTKHINITYQHFSNAAKELLVEIFEISTEH